MTNEASHGSRLVTRTDIPPPPPYPKTPLIAVLCFPFLLLYDYDEMLVDIDGRLQHTQEILSNALTGTVAMYPFQIQDTSVIPFLRWKIRGAEKVVHSISL